MDRISSLNKLDEIPGIVVGQALVVPTTERAYMVRPGDSIWSIGNRFDVSVDSIARLNGISYPYIISAGQVLRIPELSKNYGYAEVNGYIEPSTSEREREIIDEVGRYLTYTTVFSYQVNPDGSLKNVNDQTMLNTSRNHRAAPLMAITNFGEGNFDTALAHTILTNDSIQQNLIGNVIATMDRKGYYGLNVDFERVLPADRENYNNFLRKLSRVLHQKNYVLSTALAPKISATQIGEWYEAHDYPAHGEIADFIMIMTYEWGWSGGPPMAVAPINQVKRVLDYAVSVIPRKKLLMGVPLYGYNWPLPYVPGGRFAQRVSPQQALSIAARYGSEIQYDWQAQSPYFYYYDENRVRHVVWFEDARSIRVKYVTAVEYGLRGVSYWELGPSFPQNWAVLDDMFNIVKVIG